MGELLNTALLQTKSFELCQAVFPKAVADKSLIFSVYTVSCKNKQTTTRNCFRSKYLDRII